MRAADGKLGRGTKVGNEPWTESEDEEINVFDNLVLSSGEVVLLASTAPHRPAGPTTDTNKYLVSLTIFRVT